MSFLSCPFQTMFWMEIVSMDFNLSGTWTSQLGSNVDAVSDSLFEELYASRQPTAETNILTIKQVSRDREEIFFTYKTAHCECIRSISLKEINFVPTSKGPMFGTVINMDQGFNLCSILLFGPTPGVKVLETYELSNGGLNLTATYSLSKHEASLISVVKNYVRSGVIHAVSHNPLLFIGWELTCNWNDPFCHSAEALQAVNLTIQEDKTGESSRLSHLSSSEYCGGSTVVMYRIQVSHQCAEGQRREWSVHYRFRQFHALKSYIFRELANVPGRSHGGPYSLLPPFPRRAVSRLSEQDLQTRCSGLQTFMRAVVGHGGFGCANIIDVVASFLEIPSHWTGGGDAQMIWAADGSSAVEGKTPEDCGITTSSCGDSVSLSGMEETVHSDVSSNISSGVSFPFTTASRPAMSSLERKFCPFFVTVRSARQGRAAMFPVVTLYKWVPFVEYELHITRVSDDASHSVFKRFKDISEWFQEITEVLKVTHSPQAIARLNFPTSSAKLTINVPSSPSKVDVNGNFVRFRIVELERCMQALLKTCPDMIFLPLVRNFLELNIFDEIDKREELGDVPTLAEGTTSDPGEK